jgi:hypothetical protein
MLNRNDTINFDTLSINTLLKQVDCGTQIIFEMDRHSAINVIEKIRTIYGSGDPFTRIFYNSATITLFARRLPGIIRLLQNDKKYKVRKNDQGYYILSHR